MKTQLAVLQSLLVLWLVICGIVELGFPDVPKRQFDRQVDKTEIIGAWELTPASETQLNALTEQESSWGIDSPWKSITLSSNGSCRVELEPSWLSAHSDILKLADTMESCMWDLEYVSGVYENNGVRNTPGIVLKFSHYNQAADIYELYPSELRFFNRNGKLVLWDYIGNPNDAKYQDYEKVD